MYNSNNQTDISIIGEVTLTNGTTIWDSQRNHFVGNALLGFLSLTLFNQITSANEYACRYFYLPASDWTMFLGSDTKTPTTASTTALTQPLTNETTLPSQRQIFTTDGSSTGIWSATYRTVWNQGTIAGTIGEVGLFMRMPTNTGIGWNISNTTYTPSRVLVSRLSVADNDIEPHEIDTSNPLILDWKVTFSFEQVMNHE